jgi:hypothetical protein
MEQPAKLLQNLRVNWILRNHTFIGFPGTNVLYVF